ncbi:MAG TPA: hypothetical protein DEV74_17065 [Acidovorax sp.]|nr:hypothetical protein [Acidovorax sp.]
MQRRRPPETADAHGAPIRAEEPESASQVRWTSDGIVWPLHIATQCECPQTPQALRAGAVTRHLLDQLVCAN